MFPSPVLSISGLDPEASYTLKMEILPADNKRYKFLQTEWVPVGRAEKKQVHREYVHPDSPNTGAFWMEKQVHFKVIKLTNNKSTTCEDQVWHSNVVVIACCLFSCFSSPISDHSEQHAEVPTLSEAHLCEYRCHSIFLLSGDHVHCCYSIPKQQGELTACFLYLYFIM